MAEEATTIVGERTTQELKADVDALLNTIRQVLKDNAIEVWQTYQQISVR